MSGAALSATKVFFAKKNSADVLRSFSAFADERERRRLSRKLDFFDETGLERLDGNPEALDAAVRKLHADALKIRAERALSLLDELETDTSAFLALTFVNDAATLDRALTCDCANS